MRMKFTSNVFVLLSLVLSVTFIFVYLAAFDIVFEVSEFISENEAALMVSLIIFIASMCYLVKNG